MQSNDGAIDRQLADWDLRLSVAIVVVAVVLPADQVSPRRQQWHLRQRRDIYMEAE